MDYSYSDIGACTSSQSEKMDFSESIDQIPKRSVLKLTTGGFGLRVEETEEEKRKREEEALRYSLFKHRNTTEQERFAYVEENKNMHIDKFKFKIKNVTTHLNNSTIKDEAYENSDIGSDFIPFKPNDYELASQNDLDLYFNPTFNLQNPIYNTELPIYSHKTQIINALERNNIIIVQGNTGCGKTTQVPQYILDHCAANGIKCNIIVTQPRRLAAITIAKRVCEERNWTLGSICGYRIAREAKVSELTRISYVTTGYLVTKAIGIENALNSYTHIILDEIHDREIDTDLIILIVKLLLISKYKGKIILMSATLDPELFKNYFAQYAQTKRVDLINCQFKLHQVKEYYLDEIRNFPHFDIKIPEFNFNEPILFDELIEITGELLKYLDDKENECNRGMLKINGFLETRGSVLIFVPGMEEIRRVEEYLRNNMSDRNLSILPLHSEIAIEQQLEVFKKAPGGRRKVIISTSIAESSITVNDIKYVIDFCLSKSLHWDIETNLTELKIEWAAISNMDQRKGRAGRVNDGICFRLVTRNFLEKDFSAFAEPQINRQPLDKLVLSIKRLDAERKPTFLLSHLLTPPDKFKVQSSILLLKEVGALTLYKHKKFCIDDGDITFAGRIMSELPVDLKLAKLILFGHVFGRLKSAIILAAALSTKAIFARTYKSDLEHYNGKLNWSSGLFCDFNAIVNAYKLFEKNRSEMPIIDLKRWTRDHMLEYSRLIEVKKLVKKIEGHLRDLKFLNDEIINEDQDFQRDHIYGSTSVTEEQEAIDECYIIKFIVAGAFYPNYFQTCKVNQDHCMKVLSGKDPKTTLLVRGFDDLAVLYHNKILDLFRICSDDIIIHYEQKKAYVEFKKSSDILTKISKGVYLASYMKYIKRSNLVIPKIRRGRTKAMHEIELMKVQEGVKYESSNTMRITTDIKDTLSDPNLLIKNLNEFYLNITFSDEIGHFWCQIDDEDHRWTMENEINDILENHLFEQIPKVELKVGMLCVALTFSSLEKCDFCRARIDKINRDNVELFYIDYGNSEEKDFDLLFKMPSKLSQIPYQAISCSLINMKINDRNRLNREWLEKASEKFSALLIDERSGERKKLKARIYSILNNEVRITLYECTNLTELDVLKKMKKLELVENCEETEQSNYNHQQRMNNYFLNECDSKSKLEFIQVRNLTDALKDIEFEDLNSNRHFEVKVDCPLKSRVLPLTQQLIPITNLRIASDSVNRVLLDDEPETDCSSLLVASRYTSNTRENENSLTLQETCLFPKLKGIVSLCLMVFTPCAELRVDKFDKRYTGVLCGLGFDTEAKKPLYPENDVEHAFECEFDNDDIKTINAVRFSINGLIGSEESAKQILENPKNLVKAQQNNRKFVFKLFQKDRKLCNPSYFDKKHKWEKIPNSWYQEDDKIQMVQKNRMRNRAFYMQIRQVDFSKIN